MSQSQRFQVFKLYTLGLIVALFSVNSSAQSTSEASYLISAKPFVKSSWRSANLVRTSQAAARIHENLPMPKCGVKAYKIQYRIPLDASHSTTASALLQVPDCVNKDGFPVLVYNHSTRVQRADAPSVQAFDPEAWGTAMLFASYGVLVVLPDYRGLGTSKDSQYYLTRQTGELDVYDAIEATTDFARKNNITIGPELFVSGYSQGAHVTLATVKKLEDQPIPGLELKGAAPLSGVYGLEAEALAALLKKGNQALSVFFLMATLTQYNIDRGDLPELDQVIQSPYINVGRSLLDGKIPFKEAMSKLPEKTKDLFTREFADRLKIEKQDNSLVKRLSAESVDNFPLKTPIFLYSSPTDETASSEGAKLAAHRMETNGVPVKLVIESGEKLDHINASLPAFLKTRQYFSELSPRMKEILGTTFAPLKY